MPRAASHPRHHARLRAAHWGCLFCFCPIPPPSPFSLLFVPITDASSASADLHLPLSPLPYFQLVLPQPWPFCRPTQPIRALDCSSANQPITWTPKSRFCSLIAAPSPPSATPKGGQLLQAGSELSLYCGYMRLLGLVLQG